MSGRPSGGYYLDGERIPSVTTITGRFKESGGLIHWAWKLGCEGKDYREVRDDAAAAGTLTHKLVEAWVRNKGEPEFMTDGRIMLKPTTENVPWTTVYSDGDPEILRCVRNSFEAFIEWASGSGLKVTQTETPLVSHKHRFGGTFDAIVVNGRRALGDWKTSNQIYPEYMIQLAAYGALWEENFPAEPLDGGYHLIRFDKETAGFTHKFWPDLAVAWRAFLHMRSLYDDMKELTKRAA